MGLKLQNNSILTIPCIADTWAYEASPNSNYGSSASMYVLGYAYYFSRCFLKFDVPAISPDDIASAEFFIFYESNDMPSREQRHHVKRITSSWAEGALTYNNAPSFYGMGSLTGGSYGTLVNVDGHLTGTMKWRSVDLTSLVKEWCAGTYANHGIVMDHSYDTPYDGGYWANMGYRSKEYSDPAFRPYLKIVLNTPAVGGAVYGPYDLSDAPSYEGSDISWNAIVPEYTVLVVKTAVRNDLTEPADEEYEVATSGTAIPGLVAEQDLSSAYLWIKVEMSSASAELSPEITSLSWYVSSPADPKKIKVVLSEAGRMKHPQGDVTVVFTGSLLGPENAAVAPFTESFTPTGIEPFFNPNDPEYIELFDVIAQAVSHPIDYVYAQSTPEYIEIASATAVAIRYHINDIPE